MTKSLITLGGTPLVPEGVISQQEWNSFLAHFVLLADSSNILVT